jgi:Uma2 family endonuclease
MPTTIIEAPTSIQSTTTRSYTAAELMEISTDSSHRYALIQGELIVMAPAGYEHGDRAMSLGARMRIFAEDHDLGSVCAAETGFRLDEDPDTVVAPDVGFVRKARLPDDQAPSSYFPGPPDLAVEVVSPNDRPTKVSDKVKLWLRYGTRLVWVLNAKAKTVTAHRLDGSVRIFQVDELLDGEDVLPGFQFAVSRLFR